MHLVIYSHGFPNPVEKHRSPFVKEIIRFLPDDIMVTVVAPVPYFLGWRRKKRGIKVPKFLQEKIGKRMTKIHYPRYPLLPKKILRPFMGWLEALFTLRLVKHIHKLEKIDLIHANWGYPDGVAVSSLHRWLKIPYVITEHQGSIADLLNKKYYNLLISRAYRNSKKMILVSKALIEPLKLAKGRIPDPVILPNGLDPSKFEPALKSVRPSKLLYIGNLFWAKGVQFLIQAMAILKSQGHDFSLDIIGSGAYGRELEQLASKLNVRDRVSFEGVVLPDRIPELLTLHDALVLPTLKESFGIVLIEALAAGLPVISTCSGGPEHIVSPEVGILVKPGSGKSLSEGILQLLNKWDDFEPERIREYCRNHYDIRQISPKLAQIYREAVDTK